MSLRLGQEVQTVPRQAQLRRIQVVAGILLNNQREVLVAERIGDSTFHGLWEFPGGKIDMDEDPPAALARELREELGIQVVDSRFFLSLRHDYDDRRVSVEFFLVDEWHEEPAGLEGQALRWVAIEDLSAADLLPADAPVVTALRRLDLSASA